MQSLNVRASCKDGNAALGLAFPAALLGVVLYFLQAYYSNGNWKAQEEGRKGRESSMPLEGNPFHPSGWPLPSAGAQTVLQPALAEGVLEEHWLCLEASKPRAIPQSSACIAQGPCRDRSLGPYGKGLLPCEG